MTLIPMVNIKETRRAIYAYLAVYRRYQQQLQDGIIYRPLPAKPGYEDAVDSDLIRRVGDKLGAGGGSPEGYREGFCARVDYSVRKLPPYGREIIVRRLMTLRKGYRTIHELPSDDEVLMAMKRDGWVSEKTYYDQQKAERLFRCLQRC